MHLVRAKQKAKRRKRLREAGLVEGGADVKAVGAAAAVAEQSAKKKVSFQTMGLSHDVLKGVLNAGYTKPTPIQRKSIPLVLKGHDVVAMARTGSGKTAAFLIPMLQLLGKHSEVFGARALVLSPTRALALQTLKFVRELGRFTNLRSCLITGGDSMDDQFTDLSLNPDIVVATPGRLLHHLVEADFGLGRVEYVVLDEADRLYESGFSEQIDEIMKRLKPSRQTLLFSATLPAMVYEFAKAGLKQPKLIRLDKTLTLPPNMQLSFFTVRSDNKVAAFLYLMKYVVPEEHQTIVFCSTRHHTLFLQQLLRVALDLDACAVFGAMDHTMRKLSVERFTHKEMRVMLVTDVAARGIDIPSLQCVINYDMPPTPKIFVHRVGRVGRGLSQDDPDARWDAFSLVSTVDMAHMVDVHLFLNRQCSNERAEGEAKADCYYGQIPAMLLDAESDLVRRLLKNHVDLALQWRTVTNASKNFMKTRAVATKEAARLSQQLDNTRIHPLLLEMGAAAGVDTTENERLDFVENFLSNFRPKQTVLELTAGGSEQSRAAMEAKRNLHTVREDEARERDEMEEEQPDGEEAAGSGEPQQLSALPSSVNSSSSAVAPAAEAKPVVHKKRKAKRRRKSSKKAAAQPGEFKGIYKDPEFFMELKKTDVSRKQEEGLSIKGTLEGERDMIMDLMGDEPSLLKTSGRGMVWDRKRKKYVGRNEVKEGFAGVKEGSGTRKLVNEAGKRVKRGQEKKRGKIYEDWMRKQRTAIPTVGSREGSESSAQYRQRNRERGRRGKHAAAAAGPAAGKQEVRSLSEVAKLKKEREKSKLKNMPKHQRRQYIAAMQKKQQQRHASKVAQARRW